MARHSMIASVFILLLRENQICLLRRFQTGHEDGNYSLPAGHVEDNESILGAAIREAQEEVGVKINPKRMHLRHVMRRFEPGNDRIDFFFVTEKWVGSVRNAEPEKCDEVIWTDMNDLPENTVTYIREFIEHFKREVFFSDTLDMQD